MSQKKKSKNIARSFKQYCGATFLLFSLFQANAYSLQDSLHINLKASKISISEIFNVLHHQTGYIVFYNNNLLNTNEKMDVDFVNEDIRSLIDYVIKGKDLNYIIKQRLIILHKKQAEQTLRKIEVSDQNPDKEIFEFTVKGVVKTSADEPLAGVSVTLKGTKTGTTTNSKGEYSLTVPNGNGILIFSFIGFENQEVRINNESSINVRLVKSETTLSQIVVTALGIRQERRALSYSTQSVAPEQLTEARELNVINSLEGKVAGLQISQSGAGVGSTSRVTLRGNRSISGDSQPLYVIDGVPTLGAPEDLDPDDIASIDILKGANAAALYGSDAQNGAIIIATKKGKPNQVHISFNNTGMLQKADLGNNFQNVYAQGTAGVYQSGAAYSWGPKMEGQKVANWTLDPSRAGETYSLNPQPNNVMDIFQTGYNLSHNLQVSLGGKNTQTFFSATSTEASGILPNNNLLRNSALARITGNLSDKFTFDTKLSYIRQQTDNPTRQSDNNFNPMQQVYTIPRNIRTKDAKNYEFPNSQGVMQQDFWSPGVSSTAENPYWVLNRNISNDLIGRFTGLVSLKYDFTNDLNLMIRTSYDRIDDSYEQKDYNGTLVRALYGRYTKTISNNYIFNNDFLLSYKRKFNSNWAMDIHAGGNSKRLDNESLSSNTGDALLVPNLFSMSNTNLPITSYAPGSPLNIQSLYAFGNFSWKDAIYFNLTGRNDWSSTLPSNSRSYFYPSAGVSAILSKLIPSFPEIFSVAKVRASWAKVGSSPSPFMLQRTASFVAGGTNGFLSLSNVLPNTNLKPEQTKSFETGFNVGFLNGRVGLDFTYFKTNTVDQLFTIALPVGSGASSFFTNGGNIQNKGVEIVLNTVPIQTKDVTWNVDFNFSHIKNTVVSISDQRPKVAIAAPGDQYFSDFVIQQGKDFGDMYTVGFVRDSLGRVIVGTNGLPQVSNQRNFDIGSYTPDWTGSIMSSISYKSLSLSVVIEHRQGGVVGSFTEANLDFWGDSKRTLQGRDGGLIFGENFFSNYTAVNADGTKNTKPVNAEAFWRVVGNPSVPVGEVYAQDATNTRLREVVVGYTLPKSIVNRLHLANVKLSFVGRNLFFISRATPGLDPDILAGTSTASEGFSSFPPPTTRSYGINLKIDIK
jgi:TonB-linked SusC/RagA family outer membrane protein